MSLQHNIATIPVGQGTSDILSKGYKKFTKLYVTGFTGVTNLLLSVSQDGVTFRNLQFYTPGLASPLTVFTITPGIPAFTVSIPPDALEGVNFFQFAVNGLISGPDPCVIRLS